MGHKCLLKAFLLSGGVFCFQGARACVLTCKSALNKGCKCARQVSVLRFHTGWKKQNQNKSKVVRSVIDNYTICAKHLATKETMGWCQCEKSST